MENTLGTIIKTTRKEKGFTQGHLAKLCGLSKATIGHIETGKNTNPSSATLNLLSKHLGVDLKTAQSSSTVSTNLHSKSAYEGKTINSPSQNDLELISLLCNNISKLSEKEKSIIRLLLQ